MLRGTLKRLTALIVGLEVRNRYTVYVLDSDRLDAVCEPVLD